jgi:UDP-3-O-[3-hydroxymyristoyl] glucosamine N-acyltransferase
LAEIKEIGVVDVKFGSNVTVIKPVNLYGCEIGDDCFIGPFVEIQSNVKIGARTRIQSHSFICELVSIGEDCFIAHGVMFVNDLFKAGKAARDEPALWQATVIGNNVTIGSNVTVLPVNICNDVTIGASAVVTRDITEPGRYFGNLARLNGVMT